MAQDKLLHSHSGFITKNCGSETDIDTLKRIINKSKNAPNWIDLVNSNDENNQTPLTVACFYRNLKAVKALVDAGANPAQADKKNNFPLLIAESPENGKKEIADFLSGKLMQNNNEFTQNNYRM